MIRLHIDNDSYEAIRRGVKNRSAWAINDYVSTSRHDRRGLEHQYETRQFNLLAFMGATVQPKRVKLVSTDCPTPIVAIVANVGRLAADGTRFAVTLRRPL